MLVFSAITPHSPLLLPTIGRKHQTKLKKTLTSIQEIEKDLYISKPDTLIIFSPHGTSAPSSFAINFNSNYKTNLEEFGDFSTKLTFRADSLLIERIQHFLRYSCDLKINLVTEAFLDYGTTVPLFFITQHLPKISIVPIFDSGLSLEDHYNFGKHLHEKIVSEKKRIAVVASADLSHCLTNKAPGGFSPIGKKFDHQLVHCLKEKDIDGLMELEGITDEAKACGLKTILMLIGALGALNYSPKLLSYEGPFGVGYLTAKFKLP